MRAERVSLRRVPLQSQLLNGRRVEMSLRIHPSDKGVVGHYATYQAAVEGFGSAKDLAKLRSELKKTRPQVPQVGPRPKMKTVRAWPSRAGPDTDRSFRARWVSRRGTSALAATSVSLSSRSRASLCSLSRAVPYVRLSITRTSHRLIRHSSSRTRPSSGLAKPST